MNVFHNVYVCTISVPGALESQKRTKGPLELQFPMAVNHHSGAGI